MLDIVRGLPCDSPRSQLRFSSANNSPTSRIYTFVPLRPMPVQRHPVVACNVVFKKPPMHPACISCIKFRNLKHASPTPKTTSENPRSTKTKNACICSPAKTTLKYTVVTLRQFSRASASPREFLPVPRVLIRFLLLPNGPQAAETSTPVRGYYRYSRGFCGPKWHLLAAN
jgi:hypothetical protein